MTAAVSRSVPTTPHSTRSASSSFRTQPITTTTTPRQPTVASLLALSTTLPSTTSPTTRSTHLLTAAKADDLPSVSRLVGSTVLPSTHPLHVNVNESDEWGMTSLHYAALNGNAEMCDELLTHAANPNSRDRYGQTPLLLAASKCHYLALQQLLSHKASLALLPPTLVTPLHRVAAYPHPHQLLCADALLQARQKVDAQTTEGNTPLHVAVQSGSIALISWLLTHSANPNVTNHTGHTPLALATADSLIEDELLSYGALCTSRPVSVAAQQRGAVKAAERRRVEDARREREAATAAAEEEVRRQGEVRAKYSQAEVKEGLEGKWLKEEQDAELLTARQHTVEEEEVNEEAEEEEEGEGEVVLEEEDDEEARRAYREKMYSMWSERQAAASTGEPVVKSAWE